MKSAGLFLAGVVWTLIVILAPRWIVTQTAGSAAGNWTGVCCSGVLLLAGAFLWLSMAKRKSRPAASVDDEQDDLD